MRWYSWIYLDPTLFKIKVYSSKTFELSAPTETKGSWRNFNKGNPIVSIHSLTAIISIVPCGCSGFLVSCLISRDHRPTIFCLDIKNLSVFRAICQSKDMFYSGGSNKQKYPPTNRNTNKRAIFFILDEEISIIPQSIWYSDLKRRQERIKLRRTRENFYLKICD